MADIKNLPNCATPDSVFNVGVPLCDLTKKKLRGIILMDKGVSFTAAEMASAATFLAAIRTRSTAARGSRVYPIWDLLNFEDNTGDPATGGVGNMSTATIITSDAVPAFSFGYTGGEIRHKRMQAMAGAALDVMFVDAQYAVYGTEENGNFAGYDILQTYVDASKFIVSDAVNQYRFRITLANISQYRELSTFAVTNAGILSIAGLVGINNALSTGAVTVPAATFTVIPTADGGTNLYDLYGATLASASLWSVKKADGTVVTITTVAGNAGSHGYDITLDATMWAAILSGATLRINESAASVLSAAGVKPYEGLELVVTKA